MSFLMATGNYAIAIAFTIPYKESTERITSVETSFYPTLITININLVLNIDA